MLNLFPPLITHLILQTVALSGNRQDLKSCSLISPSFRYLSQSALFYQFTADISYQKHGKDLSNTGSLPQELIDYTTNLARFLKESPHIRDHIRCVRLVFDADLVAMNHPDLVPSILKTIWCMHREKSSGIRSFELYTDGTCTWRNFSQPLQDALFGFILLHTGEFDAFKPIVKKGGYGGIEKLIIRGLELPLGILQLCSSLDSLCLYDCRLAPGPVWYKNVMETFHTSRTPPRIRLLSYGGECGPLSDSKDGCLYDGLPKRLLSRIEHLEYFGSRDDRTLQEFWKLVNVNVKYLTSLSFWDFHDCAVALLDKDSEDRLCNFRDVCKSANLSKMPCLRLLHIKTALFPVTVENPCTLMPNYILELFDPSPRDNSPISIQEIDIVFRVSHTHFRCPGNIAETLRSRTQLMSLAWKFAGPRYQALRRVKVTVEIEYQAEGDCSCGQEEATSPAENALVVEELTRQFDVLPHTRIEFSIAIVTSTYQST